MRTDLTRWIATTPHLQPHTRGPRLPWKTVHARRDGTHTTACGQQCVQWHTLWEYRLQMGSVEMCDDCVIELRRQQITRAQLAG